jgi:hypothetical protein
MREGKTVHGNYSVTAGSRKHGRNKKYVSIICTRMMSLSLK